MPSVKRMLIKGATTSPYSLRCPTDYDMHRDGITQSLLGAFLACPLRGMCAVNRWARLDSLRKTAFGSCFHEVLDWSYTHKKAPKDKAAILKIISDMEWRGQTTFPPGMPEFKEQCLASVCEMVPLYFKHYSKDFTDKNFVALEETRSARFGRFRIMGKIDGEFTQGVRGSHWLFEHKTKGRIDEDFLLAHLSIDFQNLYYITIYEALYPERKIAGTLYNVIRTPQALKKKSITEAVRADPAHYFKRWEVRYTEKMKARFRAELQMKLEWVESFLTGERTPYRNEFACNAPFPCEYIEACSGETFRGYIQRKKLFEELEG